MKDVKNYKLNGCNYKHIKTMSRSDKHIADNIYKHNLAKNNIEELWKASPGSFNATEVAKHVKHIQPSFSRALFQNTPPTIHKMKPPHTIVKH